MASMAGCGDPVLGPADAGLDEDGGRDGRDGSGPADGPAGFVPIHVLPETLISGAPDLILSANPSQIDTTALTINGVTSPYFVRQGEYAVLFANAFSVQNAVVVTGASALIVVASDRVSVFAQIDLGAAGRTPGPGAPATGPGGGTAGQSMLFAERASSGGGGGSYGTVGAPGGTFNATLVPAGIGGVRYGMELADPLVGGSQGGNGGFAITAGAGGAGGGALQLSSAISIELSPTGYLKATGGGGAGGGGGFVGGGGGGAGGEILLEAPAITVAGRLVANGGGGGGGGAGCGGCATTGMDGQNGIVFTTPAPGGVGGIPQGSPGGAGAAGAAGSFAEAQPGNGDNSKGGGGGGGAGRIWLRYRTATPPNLTGAVVSPPAGIDPTLP